MEFNDRPRQNNFNNGPVQKHKAVCTECKKECEVPFKPTPGKDVFCQACFAKKPKTPRRY
jgi:CxxC-x17-CxxC domain-containing protein